MSRAMHEPLQRLSDALAGERRALLDNDAESLMRALQDKLEALRAIESDLPNAERDRERLRELAEANRANGALLARRRREVNWALRHLGRSESAPAYDVRGQANAVRASRELAVA
jgi:hypothetical protein